MIIHHINKYTPKYGGGHNHDNYRGRVYINGQWQDRDRPTGPPAPGVSRTGWHFGKESTPVYFAEEVGNGVVNHPITRHMPKHIYARWLNTLPFKRGDYVIHVAATKPFTQHQFNRVQCLVEAQFLLDFDYKDRPLVLKLQSGLGTVWTTNHFDYKVIDVEEVPEEFRFDLKPEHAA